jgi:hypothetical protein
LCAAAEFYVDGENMIILNLKERPGKELLQSK